MSRVALLVLVLVLQTAAIAAGETTRSPQVGILPPSDPATNVAVPSNLTNYTCTSQGGSRSCTGVCVTGPLPTLNTSAACTAVALQAIDRARASEGVGALRLPSNWSRLTVPEQLFVLADLERVDRGLPPYVSLVPQLSSIAQAAAGAARDPSDSAPGVRGDSGNWSTAAASPLIADFEWMYSDGFGGANVNCTHRGAPGCWGHRNDILGTYTGVTCSTCSMGAGFDPRFRNDGPVYTELFVEPASPTLFSGSFTWARSVLPYLP